MINFRHLVLSTAVIVGVSAPAGAQVAGAGGPAPGSGNGAAIASSNRDENSAYNKVIGNVGADPVKAEKAKREALKRAVPATPADVKAGAQVRDKSGVTLGHVESIDGDSAVLNFASGKIRYPLIGFGKDANGLLINLSTQEFLALAAKATHGG
ncbi:MAG: hypothetical protein ACJ8EY_10210 [Sphingomicrobium sp.]